MSFGERMAILRHRRKISQLALAETLGTSAAIISTYENDKVEPTVHRIKEICEALGVTATELLGF